MEKLWDLSSSASLVAVSWNWRSSSTLESTWLTSEAHGEVSPRYALTAGGLLARTGLSPCPLLDVVPDSSVNFDVPYTWLGADS